SFCLFLLILRLPGFLLFPYTTLFRSIAGSIIPVLGHLSSRCFSPFFHHALYPLSCSTAGNVNPITGHLSSRCFLPFAFFHVFVPDRKSTRLNSIHVKISYAVFCFKNK